MRVNPLARVARTPRPPYYAVTTTTELAADFDERAYMALATRLYTDARTMEGFLGLEAFFENKASIAVSYWTTLEAIDRWRHHPLHQAAKARAKSEWFGPTITRIARVEADYGFNLEPK
jgi:heme-degrading monooxygenase HmoA